MFIKKIFSIFISIFLMVCLPISAYADTFSVQMVPTDGRHLDFVDDSNPNYEAIIINADVRGSGTYRGDFDMTGGPNVEISQNGHYSSMIANGYYDF